jgi:hypothetical protein
MYAELGWVEPTTHRAAPDTVPIDTRLVGNTVAERELR